MVPLRLCDLRKAENVAGGVNVYKNRRCEVLQGQHKGKPTGDDARRFMA
jgi:hypothetical protein